MIALSDFKILLGSYAEQLTDEQIEWLHAVEYKFADAIFNQWLRKNQKLNRGRSGNNTHIAHNVSEIVIKR